MERAPHPVRAAQKKKIARQEEFKKKSEREVLEEFKILSEMFSIDKDSLKDKTESTTKQITKDVLNVVSLSDDTSYNDLW